MADIGLHEAGESLSAKTKDMHRALVSLQEELEAVDWYRQRADACTDAPLRAILLHNMEEEIEHAAMVLEWLRRNHPAFDTQLRTYLFTSKALTTLEEEGGGEGKSASAPERPSARRTIGGLGDKK